MPTPANDGDGQPRVAVLPGAPVRAASRPALHPSALLRSLRPLQWTKNAVVFAAVVAGDAALTAAYSFGLEQLVVLYATA